MGEIWSVYGCILGILIQARFFGGMRPYAKAKLEWLRAPARFVLLAELGYPIMKYFRTIIDSDESVNPVTLQIVTRGVPFFLAALWMFCPCDLISLKLRFYKKAIDFQKREDDLEENDDEYISSKKLDLQLSSKSV